MRLPVMLFPMLCSLAVFTLSLMTLSSCSLRPPPPMPPSNPLQPKIIKTVAQVTDDDATSKYKTRSPFATPETGPSASPQQQAGQASQLDEDDLDVNPLLDEEPHVQMRQENELNGQNSANPPNTSVAKQNRWNFADTSRWEAPANQEVGNPSDVPGTTNTSPNQGNRAFGTFGRAIPFAPSGPGGPSS
jgi:hypothetical protein